jgi:hypothetical protein
VQFNDDLAGGIVLLRPALRSPNYAAGVSGWTINIDGSAEFNNVTVRGTLQSSNYVAGTSGWKLDQAGTAELNQLTARGTMQSSNYVANTTGWKIDNTGTAEFNSLTARGTVQSGNYAAGTTGWKIDNTGTAEFNNVTVRGTFQGTRFTINASGEFLYSGTPAAGNLATSIAPVAGTDAFGNAYLDGVQNYIGTSFTGIAGGNVWFGDMSTGYSGAGLIGASGSTGIFLQAPTYVQPDASTFTASAGSAAASWSSSGYPNVNFGASAAGTMVWVADAVVKSNAAHTAPITWQTPTFSGTWSSTNTLNGNSTFQGMRYRKDAEDNVWILGAATTTGAGGSVFTLPAGYFHTTRRHLLPCYIFDSSAAAVVSGWAQVTETGVVNIAASLAGVTIAASDQIFINGKFPLGNLT